MTTYRTTWRPSPRQLRRQRNKALLKQQDEIKRQEQQERRLREQEARKLKPKALHEALVRRQELFTDEEMAEECACSVEQLLALEDQFLDDTRRKYLDTLGFALLCVRKRKVMAQDLSSELW